jgi:peptidyl-tRNA hydrolase
MEKPTVYLFLNKSLHMSVGKAAAQAAHAAIMAVIETYNPKFWTDAVHRYVIVLEARNEVHIRNIKDYLEERGIRARYIVDEGINEVDPQTITALATDIVDKDDARVQLALSSFDLYRDDIKVTLEVPR